MRKLSSIRKLYFDMSFRTLEYKKCIRNYKLILHAIIIIRNVIR